MPGQRGAGLGRVVMKVVTPGLLRDGGGRGKGAFTRTETLLARRDEKGTGLRTFHGYKVDVTFVIRTTWSDGQKVTERAVPICQNRRKRGEGKDYLRLRAFGQKQVIARSRFFLRI